jgi:hypothetical protein
MVSTISGCAPVTTNVGVKMITSLQQNEVFVFGSNLSGFHGAGSAGYAMRGIAANTWRDDVNFRAIMSGKNPDKRGLWAVFGVGRGFQVGLTGRSYAIPTVERPGFQGIVTEAFFLEELRIFVAFARSHPELIFRVVKLGANRAEGGYSYLGLEAVKRCLDIIREESAIPSNIMFPDELISFPVVDEVKECVEMVETTTGTSTSGTNGVEVLMNDVVKCTCCSEEVNLGDYKKSTNPRAPKVAWDVAHFKLCEMCLNSSIAGYDQTGCTFQTPGKCTNPLHPGEVCLGHKCPLNNGTIPHRTSLLDGLAAPKPIAKEVVAITKEMIDAMYLVGYYGNTFSSENVELFSSVPSGKAEVVYVYPDATFSERSVAQKYAKEHNIPIVLGGMGTCAHCHAENVQVEEDLDTILCAPCRKMLYSQGASPIKEESA